MKKSPQAIIAVVGYALLAILWLLGCVALLIQWPVVRLSTRTRVRRHP